MNENKPAIIKCPDDFMTMAKAMAEATKLAHEYNRKYWLFWEAPGYWLITPIYGKDWLFKAYPGGRKILSVAGKKKMDEFGEIKNG